MSTPYKDLEFSFSQHLILLRLKYFKMKKETIYSNSKYDFLRVYSLIEYQKKNRLYCVLNEKGCMYLRYKRRSKIRFWIPVIISIAALFAGYDVYTNPLLAQALREIVKLLKNILENLDAFF